MIWVAIRAFASANMMRLLAASAIAAGLFAIWGGAYYAGKKAAHVDALEHQVKIVGRVHAIEDHNRATLRDGDAVKQLLEHWSRD